MKKAHKANFKRLYNDYGTYNILYNQLVLPSHSTEYAWRRTKKLLQEELIRILKAKLSQSNSIRVCDLGCGNGAFLIRIAALFPTKNISFVGYDISESFVEYANKAANYKSLKNVSFSVFDIDKEKLKQVSFDVIISSEVLEHVVNPRAFLEKTHAALKQNGILLLSTPNAKNAIKYPFFFLKQLIARKQSAALEKQLTAKEQVFKLAEQEQHLYVFVHDELHALLRKTGFEVYATPRSTTLFGGSVLDSNRWLFALTLMVDSFLDRFGSPKIGWDLLFFCEKN